MSFCIRSLVSSGPSEVIVALDASAISRSPVSGEFVSVRTLLVPVIAAWLVKLSSADVGPSSPPWES